MLLVMAAVFAVVAIVMPEARREAFGAVILLIVVALFRVPVVLRFFLSFTGDEEVLTNGVVGSATITSLEPTGWRYNRDYPIVNFGLSVEASGAAYPVEVKQRSIRNCLIESPQVSLSRYASIGKTTRRL